MTGILTERPRQVPNLCWQPNQPIGAPVSTFRQIKYIPLPNAVFDLDQALSGARVDCGRDFHKQLIDVSGAAKVWITVQVEYEPVNPLANQQPFDQYLSAHRLACSNATELSPNFETPISTPLES